MALQTLPGWAQCVVLGLVAWTQGNPPATPPAPPAAGEVAGTAASALGQAAAQAGTQTVQALRDALTPDPAKLAQKLLQPSITQFTLGGFRIERVEADEGAKPEAFSGRGWAILPAPLGGRAVTFKGLAVSGGVATGTATGSLDGWKASHQGWTWTGQELVLSDQGSRLKGTLTAGRLTVRVDSVPLTPEGLAGTLALGSVPLGDGPFSAEVVEAELHFSAQPPALKGGLAVTLGGAFRDADSGAPAQFTAALAVEAARLFSDGVLAETLAGTRAVESQGLIFRFDTVGLACQGGAPALRGQARLGFPLQTFCQAADTGQPYQSGPAPVALQASAGPAVTRPDGNAARLRLASGPDLRVKAGKVQGFTGSFPLGAALLHPSGLLSYRLSVEQGLAVVQEGALDAGKSRLRGALAWGPGFASQATFKDVPVALADGLYLTSARLAGEVAVGPYGIQAPLVPLVCDFSSTRSPAGLAPEWKGVHLPTLLLSLPEELFRFQDKTWTRLPVFAAGKDGVFEADGQFSGRVAVKLDGQVNLHIVPVTLEPFQLEFGNGALLDGPRVQGTVHLDQPPLLENLDLPIAFDLTPDGVRRIQVQTGGPQGDGAFQTGLVGIDLVLAEAVVNPTNLDLSGRFDFHLAGSELPAIPFAHLVMEATGGGIDGKPGPIALGVVGGVWNSLPGQSRVELWGYGFGLQENGFGTKPDGRFYVGVGGQIEVNPVLSTVRNRFLFTTDAQGRGTVEVDEPFSIDQDLMGMGSVSGSLGFKVETVGEQVTDAYFLGNGKVGINVGDVNVGATSFFRFGRCLTEAKPFPYFFLMAEATIPGSGIVVAQDVQIYGFLGGLAQNFLPDEIRASDDVAGKPDSSLGLAVMAGVQLGSADQFVFHGDMNLYIAQNLTTLIQGKGYLLAGRDSFPEDRVMSAELAFTRNPNALHAVLASDLGLFDGLLRSVGTVEMRFDPVNRFVHVGTVEAPLSTSFVYGLANGTSYYMADLQDGKAVFKAGGGFSLDTGERTFGVVWGRAYLNVWGDLVIIVDSELNPAFQGVLNAQGGAAFGMKFKTFWKTYRLTIFSGDIQAAMAFQAPGSPTLAGGVTVSYRVLGGLFSGSVNVNMELP